MATEWLPLESNPDVMNKFLYSLGVPQDWAMVDVIGLDEENLQNVPRPVAALIFLFPTGEKHEEFRQKQQEEIEASGDPAPDSVYFMQQSVKNACGTAALIHAVANTDKITLDGGALHEFLESTRSSTPKERGQALESNESIGAAHNESAQEGQTAPSGNEENLHFITFVYVDGNLYELDGQNKHPVNHGTTSEESLLEDASAICKQFIERDPENVNFTVVALAATPSD